MGRGPSYQSQRSGIKPQLPNEATGRISTYPAPYGGWNANGNLSNMPPLDAVIMDNVFPGITDVMVRKGSAAHATGLPSAGESLLVYEGRTGSKVFAGTDSGVYNVTATGAVGSAEFSCTNGRWVSLNFANSAGSFLVAVNGTDEMRVYDNSAWTAINATSVPAITGVLTTAFSKVSLHAKRLWFVEKDSMSVWYLPVDSFGGAATEFPVGSLFNRGGSVIATASWTVDSGAGMNDYFLIMTTKGEVAAYQGTDPSSSTTWGLVGVYFIGEPVGDNPMTKLGGEMLILTVNGLFPISEYLQSSLIDRTAAINFKV